MRNDIVEVTHGIAYTVTVVAIVFAIIYLAPEAIRGVFAGLYAFWQMVGVM